MSAFPFETAWFDLGPDGAKRTSCAAALACAPQDPAAASRPGRLRFSGRFSLRESTGKCAVQAGFWRCGMAVFLARHNRQYFSCKAIIAFAGRASVAVQKTASFLLRGRKLDV